MKTCFILLIYFHYSLQYLNSSDCSTHLTLCSSSMMNNKTQSGTHNDVLTYNHKCFLRIIIVETVT